MNIWEELEAKAKELGATYSSTGINWTWKGFPSEQAGKAFLNWLDSKGLEHRGCYPNDDKTSWDIRHR